MGCWVDRVLHVPHCLIGVRKERKNLKLRIVPFGTVLDSRKSTSQNCEAVSYLTLIDLCITLFEAREIQRRRLRVDRVLHVPHRLLGVRQELALMVVEYRVQDLGPRA